MSADDDTFEIDIYGDDQPEQPPVKEEPAQDSTAKAELKTEPNETPAPDDIKPEPNGSVTSSAQQGTKRKVPDDEQEIKQEHGQQEQYEEDYVDNRPVDPGAMPALKLADLHWWTTEEDVRALCVRAEAEEELHELSFGEHKINGKSKGEAYLEFTSPQAATAVKREVDAANEPQEGSGVRKVPFTAYFTPLGNPFKTGAGAGNKKDAYMSTSAGGGRGGAYNNFNRGGGGFGGRGNFGGRGGGGGGFNNNNANNPMMGGGRGGGGWMNNPMAAGGFGNMNPMMNMMGAMMGGRGGMNMMGGRGGMNMMGGMGGMNMGNMMGGGGRGGMMGGGGRGGWGGGGGNFQQGGFGGGAGGGYGGNKRAKME